MSIRVDSDRCPQDHRCPLIERCPMQAISQTGERLPTIDPRKCIECGLWVSECPKHAMRFE